MADSEHRISTIEQLRELYRAPHPTVEKKVRSSIDEASARYIATCPFLVLATSDGAGSVDASPRGGPPGFVKVLDDRHVRAPRPQRQQPACTATTTSSPTPYVGLLLIVPGIDETLRINGPAQMTTDPDVLDGFVEELRRPKMAIVVETAELYSHSRRRSGVGRSGSPMPGRRSPTPLISPRSSRVSVPRSTRSGSAPTSSRATRPAWLSTATRSPSPTDRPRRAVRRTVYFGTTTRRRRTVVGPSPTSTSPTAHRPGTALRVI